MKLNPTSQIKFLYQWWINTPNDSWSSFSPWHFCMVLTKLIERLRVKKIWHLLVDIIRSQRGGYSKYQPRLDLYNSSQRTQTGLKVSSDAISHRYIYQKLKLFQFYRAGHHQVRQSITGNQNVGWYELN